MEQKTDALQQSAESIDMETLIHRISCDESVLDKIKDENILLFLGTSNAGKTTTGCFLSGKQLVFKQITFTVGDEEFVGEEVIDKVDTNGQFKIGHASDSMTKSIQICDVSSRGLILADSCGFEDTEGCTVDVANAVSLKNAMTSCHSFHPVVVVDERSISISKGMPFVKLLKLICRFFSPLNLFLNSVSFLFTHVDPGTTSAAIRTKLAKLAQADHIKRDEDLNGIMSYLLDFVKKHEANCILYAEDITSRDAGSVEQRRDSLLDMITGLAPVTRGISNQLACPLSDEAQVGLQERSGALCYSVEMSLQQHQYKGTLRDMELLKTMHTALQLPRVTAAFEKATQAVQRHVEKLNETARSYLKDFRELSELDLIMTHLRNAQALQSFHDVKIVFTCLKSDINDEVKALVDKVTSREQPDYHGDAAVLDTLRSVKEILHPYLYSDFYTHALQHVEKSIEGHNSTCEKSLLAFKTAIGAEMYKDAKDDVGAKEAPQKLASTDKKNNKKDKQKKKTGSDLEEDSSCSGSSGWLSGLLFGQKKGNKSGKGNKSERAVLKDVSNVEETSSSAEPDFDLSQIAAMGRIRLSSRDNGETSLDDVTCDLEEDGTSGSFEWFCDLFVSLSQLRKVERLHEHVSAAQVNYYCKQAGVLSELLQTICILVLGSKGLLRAVDRLSASAEQCLTLSQMHRLLRACFRHDANCHLIDPTLKSLDESVQSETIRILTRHVNSIDELDHQQKYGEIPVILELISNISLDGGALDDFRARHVHHRVDMLSKRVCKLHRQIETLISSLRDRDVLESCDIAELVHLVNIQSSAAGLDKFLLLSDSSPSTHSTGEDFSETASVTQWLDAYMQMISEMWTSTFSTFMKVATSDEGWIYESASLKREFVRLDRMNALGSLLTCVSEHSQQIVNAMNTKKERVVKKDVSSDTSSTEMHQLLELKDGLYLVFKAMESSPLLSRHELTEKWSSNCIADLVAWEKQSTVYITKHLEDVRSACKDSLAAKNSQELGKQLDVLQDFADTEGLAKYVKPAPRKLYDETKVALQQEINSMITSSELAVSRGELEKASAIRVFLEGSSSFGHHFPEVDFRDFCTGLLQKHRQATDQLPAEIAGLLERHKFGAIKSKIRNLRSDDMSDGESKCDPADRLVFGDIDEQITDWFHELEAQIQDVANSEMGEQELTSKLETHLRTVSHAMALCGIISYDPVQLLEMVYGICNEQFGRLRLRLLKKLGTHRFQQASTSYSQLKRMKNLDRSLHSHIDKLSAGGGEDGHLFAPRVERITANEVNAIGENVRVACLRYLGSDSTATSKPQSVVGPEEGDDVSEISTEGSPPAAVDVGELSALLTNTRSAANANDVLFDDLVDFCRVLSDIVRTISDVASRRLKKVQNLIMSASSLSEAAELLESIDNVVGILPAEESNASIRKLKNLLESQQRALVARNLSVFSNLTVSGESIDSTARRLEEIRSYDYHAYTEQLGAIKSAIREQLNASANTLKSDQLVEASEFRKILRLVGAVLVFRRDLIQDDLCQDMRIDCTEFITSFQELIRVQICQAVDGLYTNTDVTMIKEHLRSLKEGFESVKGFADDTFLEFLNLAIADCDECVNQAETVAASIGSDVVELRNFDLFVQQLDDVLEKLIRLSNQKSQRRTPLKLQSFSTGANNSDNSTGDGFLHVKDKISKQLDAAITNMMVHMEKDEHDAVRNSFENVTMLMRFDPLKERASEVKLEMTSCVHGQHSRLSDEFREAIRNRQYKAVDKIVNSAAALDKYLHEFLSDGEELLMHKIKAHFKQEVGDIYEDVMRARGVTESDHAQQLCLIKEIVSDISNSEIQEIAEKYITKYLDELKKRKVDFLKLGMLLQQQGNLGAEITEQHAQFKSVLTKRFNESTASITVEHTLTELQKGNPSITDEQIARLKKFATTYSETFEQDLKTYLPGYGSFRATDKCRLEDAIKASARGCRDRVKSSDIVELLAHVFALHCINTSESMFQETSNDKSCLMKPHPVQVVALLRLFAVDAGKSLFDSFISYGSEMLGFDASGVDGHLIQVGTGEGKSILLGGLSCVLALLGYEVSCASYSKHLSKRDYESFQGLFTCLDVNDRITYSTLSELAEHVINREGSVRDLASKYIVKANGRGGGPSTSHNGTRKKRILLIDEVDVFFSEDFFGSTYNPSVEHSSADTEALLRYIWDNRNSRISLQNVQQLPVYQAVASELYHTVTPLLDMQISEMIRDVNKFNDPPYEVVTLEDGDVMIGYKDQDSVDFKMSYGFKTAFAYLFESSRCPELQKHLSGVLGLSITCGKFSYAEIARSSFDCVMGVTGTLDCLSAAEKEIVRNDYKITTSTFMPSMYGASKLDFKKDKDVVMEADQNRFFQIILKEIQDEREKGRPVLVYFESTARLEQFVDSEYGRRLSEFNKVTEKTPNIPFFVNKATTAGTVTLMPRVFGRGLDFVSRDPAVDAAGGVHVIQTYFSDYLSEEIQTKGRTARQAKKGSYKMILCGTELAEKLELTIEKLQELSATSTFYDTINAKRDEVVAQKIATLKEKSRDALIMHNHTTEAVALMKNPKRSSSFYRNVISRLCSIGSTSTSEATHTIFCLDESGSMERSWDDLKQAVQEFLNIRMQNGFGNSDLVSIIQFSHRARSTASQMSVGDALNFSRSLAFGGGGTSFVPAIELVGQELRNDSSGKSPVLVFMTDGASSDPAQAPQAVQRLVSSGLATNLQFYGVAFRTDGGPLQTMANAVQGKVVSAGDVGELVNQFRNIAVSLSANRKG